ncbi:MAG: septum formation inhibitor [Epsilonproteobacteria bacterium]|nr:septum formation inhibitor [Campylobacterota bacterium]
MRQKSIRVVEIENFEELEKLQGKLALLKNHYFLLKSKDEKAEAFLKERGLNYFVVNESSEVVTYKEVEVEKVVEKIIEKVVEKEAEIFDRVIRSGEELNIEGGAVFLQRINPAARIKINGSAVILGENLGDVEVEGRFLLAKKNSARMLFNHEDVGRIDRLTFFSQNIKKVIE